jgi:iron(III) transport system ATP-binding protein
VISIENLRLTYRSRGIAHPAVRGLSLTIGQGQFCTLLGPSGCGKTTTLRCVAGLERPDSGRIVIDDEVVCAPENGIWIQPHRRNIGMVFQSYAIWPHMSVFENVAFPLRYLRPRPGRAEIRAQVAAALALVQLAGYEDRPAPFLSGGQQQRLALARALVAKPRVLLLDEPLSNLDAKLREEMRLEIRELVKRLNVTTLFVTHEQAEALTMSDIVAVMSDGEIVQQGSPRDIYTAPAHPFVAGFVGKTNFLPGRVLSTSGDFGTVETPVAVLRCRLAATAKTGDTMTVAIRPEDVALCAGDADRDNAVAGEVTSTVYLGNLLDCTVRIGEQPIHVQLHPAAAPVVGSRVVLHFPAESLSAMS